MISLYQATHMTPRLRQHLREVYRRPFRHQIRGAFWEAGDQLINTVMTMCGTWEEPKPGWQWEARR